jgi:hypothetical protein
MTLLETANLCNPFICYDWQKILISQNTIDEYLERARGLYSDFLVNIIKDMLLEDELIRPCFEDLHSLLLPY